MRITDLEVDGFGVWSGLALGELSDQVNVFYGPNEAGKTTLMQFVRSVFYGLSPERRARYLPPVRGGRPGGSVRIADGASRLRICRHGDPLRPTGLLEVVNNHGEHQSDDALAELLGDIDEEIFNNVFAFGLGEIQQLATLSDTEAAHQLYDLTMGLDRVSLVEVLRELESSRNHLLAADDRPCQIVQLLAQRQQLQGEIDELKAHTPRYLELVGQQHQVGERIKQLEAQSHRLEQQLRLLELARSIQDQWRARAQLERQLAALGPIEALPDDALGKLDRLTARIAARHEQRVELHSLRQELDKEAASLVINDALVRHTPRLEALGEQQQWIASLSAQVRQLESELLELELALAADQEHLGIKPKNAAAGQAFNAKLLLNLRNQSKVVRAARKEVRAAHGEMRSQREAITTIGGQIKSSLGKRADKGLVKTLQRSGEQVSQLRRRVQLDERLSQMSRREHELELQEQRALENQMLPTWLVAGLGVLFVFGVAFILSGFLLPISLIGSAGWPLIMLGMVSVGASGLTKIHLEHAVGIELEQTHRQLEMLKEQLVQARQERDVLDEQLPRGGGPLTVRLQSAEKELASLEELMPLAAQRQTAAREAKSSLERKRLAKAEYTKALQRWRQMLVDAGLPENLVPKQLRQYHQRHEQVRDVSRRIEQKRDELAQRQLELGVLTSRVTQLATDVGKKPRDEDPLVLLRTMLGEQKDQESRLKRRDAIVERIKLLRRKQIHHRHALARLRQKRQTLLREAGTADEAEFRRRAVAQADSLRLCAERDSLALEISASLGVHTEDALSKILDGPAELTQLQRSATGALEALKGQLHEFLEQRGQLKEQIKSLVEDRRLAQKQIEWGIVEKRLHEALERWRVLATSGRMLETVREIYQRERQPEALREASGYLARLTGGRYVRVWTPLGQNSLSVDDAAGHSLPVEVLSRGTREQLFLSLRLALVSAYALRGASLPLVLDDVLVNFDATRAKAAATVLRDYAKAGHQLLIFTCHEHIARLFKSLKADVRELPDNSHPYLSAARLPEPEVEEIEEPVRKPRRARPEPAVAVVAEPEPQPEPEPAEVLVIIAPPLLQAQALPPAEPSEPVIALEERDLEPARPLTPAPMPIVEQRIVREDPIEPMVVPQPRRVITRRVRQRQASQVSRVDWNAEEFAGELADRVRDSTEVVEEYERIEPTTREPQAAPWQEVA